MFEIDAADPMSHIFLFNYNIYFYECCHMHYKLPLKVKKQTLLNVNTFLILFVIRIVNYY